MLLSDLGFKAFWRWSPTLSSLICQPSGWKEVSRRLIEPCASRPKLVGAWNRKHPLITLLDVDMSENLDFLLHSTSEVPGLFLHDITHLWCTDHLSSLYVFFLISKMGINNRNYLIGLLWGLNEVNHAKFLKYCLTHVILCILIFYYHVTM